MDARSLDLGCKEFALLEELMRSAPRIVIKDRLEDRLYAIHEAVTPNAIEAIVSRQPERASDTASELMAYLRTLAP